MAVTREIPREEWGSFLDAFSRDHEGWPARAEVFSPEFGAQEEAEDLPLTGVTADFKEAGRERITVTLGRSEDDHVSHAVLRPTRVRLLRRDDGADEALEIESGDGPPTLLRFLSPAHPEKAGGRSRDGARSDRR